jgi:ribose 5-phosphate isomerase B
MRVALGADHAGFPLKQELTSYLKGLGHEVPDLGTHCSPCFPPFCAVR